jgi:elongator complex protein 3
VVRLGESAQGEAQHLGLGAALISAAERLAAAAGYGRLAVISAIGTREYYRKQGFEIDGRYLAKAIPLPVSS